jgi:hypothetical protein
MKLYVIICNIKGAFELDINKLLLSRYGQKHTRRITLNQIFIKMCLSGLSKNIISEDAHATAFVFVIAFVCGLPYSRGLTAYFGCALMQHVEWRALRPTALGSVKK